MDTDKKIMLHCDYAEGAHPNILKKYINIIKQDFEVKNKCIKEMKELKEFINYNKFEQSKLNEIDKFLMQIME